MNKFSAIDFETGNSKRVSACQIGYAVVDSGEIIEVGSEYIKPVGGHAPFQTKIHGITEDMTKDKPMFDVVFDKIKHIFSNPIIGHSLFDKQVLNALSDYFQLGVRQEYYDSCSIAKNTIPSLENYKLDTVADYLGLPKFNHHNAEDDAVTCARIVLKLDHSTEKRCIEPLNDLKMEYKGLILGILSDGEINYKEAYSLLYWMEDNKNVAEKYFYTYGALKNFCSDGIIDKKEEKILVEMLEKELVNGNKTNWEKALIER